MKHVLRISMCLVLALFVAGCGKMKPDERESSTLKTDYLESEELVNMKLYVNDTEVPVIWEDNDSVRELMKEVEKEEITVEMSMYGGNEQVGSLGRRYTSSDVYTTTNAGDIVLYNSSNIVVFYGSNSWEYTRLGRMEIDTDEAWDLFANGNVTLTLTK